MRKVVSLRDERLSRRNLEVFHRKGEEGLTEKLSFSNRKDLSLSGTRESRRAPTGEALSRKRRGSAWGSCTGETKKREQSEGNRTVKVISKGKESELNSSGERDIVKSRLLETRAGKKKQRGKKKGVREN